MDDKDRLLEDIERELMEASIDEDEWHKHDAIKLVLRMLASARTYGVIRYPVPA